MGVLRGRSFLAAHYHATTIAPSAMMSAQNAAACIRPAIVIVFSIKLRSPAQCAARGRARAAGSLLPRMPQQQLRSLFVTPL